MARPLRLEFEGALYHVTSRGNEKRDIFLDDTDRLNFLEILAESIKRFNWLCYAYCLMNNHYHLLIETPEANLSEGMRYLNSVYTQKFNKKHNKVGHLLQGRYKAIIIDKDSYLLEVARYIVLNPVRAKLVKRPQSWKWSSFRATAYKKNTSFLFHEDRILSQFSEDIIIAKKEYINFVLAGIGKESIWKNKIAQVLLGKDEFVERILHFIKEKEPIKEIPKRQRYIRRPKLEELFLNFRRIDKKQRNEKIYEAIYNWGYKQNEIANHLGVHYSTISKIINSRFKI